MKNTNEQTVMVPNEPLYNCSLCYESLPSTTRHPYTMPCGSRPGRIFCERCWIWIYNVAICWRCGELVVRDEERVGFGWLWWHWGCFCCLVCCVPLPPLPWDGTKKGHDLEEPPLCSSCERKSNSKREAPRLNQKRSRRVVALFKACT